jgi:hypothetical protein|tara:strand:- start:413 stop:1168 length:756 start_codon:yes stop_codon:yes gene_type:complete
MEEDNKDNTQEGFISRWSKKKANNKSDVKSLAEKENVNKVTNAENDDEALVSSEITDESEYDELNDEELLEKFNLPNPEKIKKEKGLDLFFKDGIPDRLRQIALRKVWKLNPIIRFADAEINDYHEDFTDAATVIEGMQTAYQVGRGYLSEIIDGKDKDDIDGEEDKENGDVESKSDIKTASKESIKEERPITADNETKQSLNELNSKAENKEVTKDKLDIDEIVLEKDEVGLKPLLEEKPRPKMMIFKPR